jgi:hypothetical protein
MLIWQEAFSSILNIADIVPRHMGLHIIHVISLLLLLLLPL